MTLSLSEFRFEKSQSSEEDVYEHLCSCDGLFNPHLSTYIDIPKYAKKLFTLSHRQECWDNLKLAGLVAFYINEPEKRSFISNVSVLKEYQGLGIAKALILRTFEDLKTTNSESLDLEVYINNKKVIQMYEELGFEILEIKESSMIMRKKMK